MRALHFNFAPGRGRPYLRYFFLATSLVLATYVGWLYMAASKAQRSEDARLAQLGVAPTSNANLPADARTVGGGNGDDIVYERSVVDRLSVPWDALFKEIEMSVDSSVVLLSVESNSARGTVSFIAEARSLTAMIDYARRLRAGTMLQEVQIQSHKLLAQDALRPVRFVINARLTPSARSRGHISPQSGRSSGASVPADLH